MIAFPNAKINIGLNIVEKRSDNFHNIETVFFPIGLTDILELVKNQPGRNNSFKSTGITIPGKASENLCMKAYELISEDYDISAVKIHLHKIIPIGAGLGGGSSDAAFFINLMDNVFSLKIPLKKKLSYASRLGSDCSFFIENKAAFARGRGEILEPVSLDLNGFTLVLVHPAIHVSTKDAYAETVPAKPALSLKQLIKLPVKDWQKNIFNQFENTVFKKFPAIEKIKNQLQSVGAAYASMSGSGSSVFGLFEDEVKESDLKKKFPGYFIWIEKLQ